MKQKGLKYNEPSEAKAIPTLVHLPPLLRKQLDRQSKKEGKTLSRVVRETLERKLAA